MRRFIHSLGRGLFIGAIGALIYVLPGGIAWEENTGLGALFKLRGQRAAPVDVVVVAVDGRSGRRLGLTRETPGLPRRTYARLIDRLAAAGAAVIVLDVFFRQAREPEQDADLAAAMRRAGNVILFGYLEQDSIGSDDSGEPSSAERAIRIERLQPPSAPFTAAAATVAPFVLPKVPVRINRFWTFHGANELAALPAAALKLYTAAAMPDLIRLTQRLEPAIGRPAGSGAGTIHAWLKASPRVARRLLAALTREPLPAKQQRRLTALLSLYAGPDYPYLNFYGPPQSVTTVPLPAVIGDDPAALAAVRGKVVFVGFAGRYQPRQQDSFYTVFSQPSGLDLSGVEIGATAFANLMNRETLVPLSPGTLLALVLTYGLAITLIFWSLPAYPGIGAGLLTAALYGLLVYRLFADFNLWLPWTVPVLVQTPMALLAVLFWRYREAHHGRYRLREAFGYYLPETVVDRLAQDRTKAHAEGEAAFGVCLATDAEQYTALAERMDATALQGLLNRYYARLFAPVRARDGMISDVVGDAMLAIWSAPHADAALRQKACEAALDIARQIRDSEAPIDLPTRIGLHAGQVVLSHIGAIDHYEYRAVGDIVNTATRIEGINKVLGTSLLASHETVVGLSDLVVRDLGDFYLKGKQQAVHLYEILGTTTTIDAATMRLLAAFAAAFSAYRQSAWQVAGEQFSAILKATPDDGPSRYFLSQCRQRCNPTPPGDEHPGPGPAD